MSTPLPVLFYAPYSPQLTGAPRVFLNLLERLDPAQFRPVCVSQRESPLTAQLFDRGIETVILPFPALLDTHNGEALAYSPLDKLRCLSALVRYNQQIAQLGRQYQVQGIWGRNVKSILLIGLAARWLQVPLIWDIGMEKESRGLMRALHWLGLSLSTVVVTQAASQPGDIFDALAVKCFAAKFQTIAPGVGLDRILPLSCGDRPSSPQFTLLTVGTINPRKNQLLLLQAVARLSQRYPQLRVQIVGAVTDAAYFARCQDFVQAQGLEPQVEFLGWRQDVPELMQHSQLLVLSSTNEGIPYVIREAMYAALPIVATAVGGVPAAIDHGQTGFLVESSNVEQLSHWIEHCLTHPDVCAALGQRARQAAEQKFSLAEWSAQYSTLLRQLCHA